MSDVIWAAAIAGSVGLAGNITTYLATRKQADTTLEAGREQSGRELERLAAEHREGERQSRRETYRVFVALLEEFDAWAQGYGAPRTLDVFREWLARYREMRAAVALIDDEAVGDALMRYEPVLARVGETLFVVKSAEPFEQRVWPAYSAVRDDLRSVQGPLVAAMRADSALPESRPNTSGS